MSELFFSKMFHNNLEFIVIIEMIYICISGDSCHVTHHELTDTTDSSCLSGLTYNSSAIVSLARHKYKLSFHGYSKILRPSLTFVAMVRRENISLF